MEHFTVHQNIIGITSHGFRNKASEVNRSLPYSCVTDESRV